MVSFFFKKRKKVLFLPEILELREMDGTSNGVSVVPQENMHFYTEREGTLSCLLH